MNRQSLSRGIAPLVVGFVVVTGCSRGAPGGMAPPPPEVGVAVVQKGDLPLTLEYSGRAAGSRDVEVRARVGGILLERRYEEGGAVHQGDVLFRIDPQPYRAAAAQARAELGVERARLEEARRQRDRVVPLFEKNAVSQKSRDEAVSQFEVAQANVAAAQAKLQKAELDLGYTEVRAPISGLTSREARSEGSLVNAGSESSLLTRIVQIDPAYVEFALPETEAALLRSRMGTADASLVVRVLLDNGAEYPRPARLGFLDTSVEQGSGTVRARAIVPNPDGLLVPGQFIRARVEGVTVPGAITLPRRAVMTGAQGSFAWVVGAGDVVELRPIVLGGTVGDKALIKSGLQGGERVVADGVLKVRPGVKVKIAAPEAKPAAGVLPVTGKAG